MIRSCWKMTYNVQNILYQKTMIVILICNKSSVDTKKMNKVRICISHFIYDFEMICLWLSKRIPAIFRFLENHHQRRLQAIRWRNISNINNKYIHYGNRPNAFPRSIGITTRFVKIDKFKGILKELRRCLADVRSLL